MTDRRPRVRKRVRRRVQQGRWLVRLALRVVAVLGPLLERLGADTRAVAAIVEAKLLCDARRGGLQHAGKGYGIGLALTCVIFTLSGFFVGMLAFVVEDPLLLMGSLQTAVMTMLGMVLIVDYASLLLDPADITVLAPRPVSGRTLLAARMVHLGMYMAVLVICIGIGPTILGALRQPLVWLVVFPLTTLLSSILAVLGITGVFVTMLRCFGSERIQGLVVWAQLAMTLALYGGFQLLPVLMQQSDLMGGESWWALLFPPLYFGGLYALVLGQTSPIVWALAALALLVPAGCAVLVFRLAGSRFLLGLARFGQAPDAGGKKSTPSWARRLGRLVTRSGTERAGWDLMLAMIARDRGFRMRIYPLLGIPLILLVSMSLRGRAFPEEMLGLAVLFPIMYAPAAVLNMRYCDTPSAAWVLLATPVSQHGLLVSGALRALTFVLLVPAALAVACIAWAVSGSGSLLELIVIAEMILVATWGAALVLGRVLPFSRTFAPSETANVPIMFSAMTVSGLMTALLVTVRGSPGALVVLAAVLAVLCLWLASALRRVRVKVGPGAVR